jgi:signal transduction histidine kinase
VNGRRASETYPILQPVLLAVGFVLLIVIGVVNVALVDRAAEDSRRLARTLTLQGKLSDLLLEVRRAESAQRGYLFTQNPNYLDEYYESEPATRSLLAELRRLAKASPARQASLQAAGGLLDQKFAEMSDTIRLNRNGRREDARAEVLQGRGKMLMADLRKIIDDAVEQEGRLAYRRSEQTRRTNTLLLYLTLAGAALVTLIGAISVALVRRNARERDRARLEIETTNANLERIVEYRTADLTEANQEIQRFAYIVSHDLRSPLVNIMGFTSELETLRKEIFDQLGKLSAQLLELNAQAAQAEAAGEMERLGKEFDEAIGFIKTSIGNMDRLINAVLKLSREGRRQFDPKTIDMHRLIEALLRNVAHRTEELGASVRVGSLPQVDSDRMALEQIFANLIDNALKYGRKEEPLRIEVSGRVNATHAIYEVRDNGRGIDPRDHARVFELFRRSGPQDRPGEGIGLAHVRALVRRLGGSMGLISEPGKGSTFTVTLPRRWSVEGRSAA